MFRPEPDSFDALGPQLRIGIWRGAGSLPGRTFTSADRPSTGGGYECDTAGSCAPLRTWRVRFERAATDSSLSGELEVESDPAPIRQGRFRAPWHFRVVHCI